MVKGRERKIERNFNGPKTDQFFLNHPLISFGYVISKLPSFDDSIVINQMDNLTEYKEPF